MLIAPKRLKVRTSNLACMFPGKVPLWPLKNFCEKGAWPGSRDPLNFWVLNANSSKMTKDTNYKFVMLAEMESPVMTPEKILEQGV